MIHDRGGSSRIAASRIAAFTEPMTQSSLPPLAEVFAGRRILVTGATGFLAKAWLAKVLRDLPDVGRIVLLLRPRRRPDGSMITAGERLEREVLGSSAFRRLRSELGEGFDARARERVCAIEGDLTSEALGLSPGDAEIANSVDLIVNSAATVVFDERLDLALAINTLGVRRLLELARRCGNAPLLHVSTAYTCGRRRGLILEEPPSLTRAVADDLEDRPDSLDLRLEIETIREICRQAEDEARSATFAESARREASRSGADPADARRRLLKDLLVDAGMRRARERGWNDTYTYTKSLGERVLMTERGDVPACIVRPAIIESGLHEPEPGWIDGLRMADPLFAAFGKGALRELPAESDATVDFIPVDHVVHAMLAAHASLIAAPPGPREDPPVYHVATSGANPLVFKRLVDLARSYFIEHPLRDRDGRPAHPRGRFHPDEARFFRRSRRTKRLLLFTSDALGPVPGSAAARTRARLRALSAQLDRIEYYVRIYGPYTSFPARFSADRSLELHSSLHPGDRVAFGFDPRDIDWDTYIKDIHLPGLVRNVLREPAAPPMAHSVAAEEGAVAGRTIPEAYAETVREHGGRLAVRVHEGRSYTHADVQARSMGLARHLRDVAGVLPGDRVVLWSENRPEWFIAYLGILAAGGTAVPVDAGSPPRRVAEIVRVTDARAILVTAKTGQHGIGGACSVLALEDLPPPLPDDASARAHLPVSVPAEGVASILFTSGTTLEPKGVMLAHRAFLANAESIREVLQPSADDRLVSVLPLHHSFEFTAGCLTPLLTGASVTYLETPSSQAIMEALRDTKATVLLGVPRLYELMLEGVERQLAELRGGASAALGALRGTSRAFQSLGLNAAGKALLAPIHARFGGSIRAFVSGGAALDPAVHRGFSALGFTLAEGYGLTETAPVLTVNPLSGTRAGSVGKALPGVDIRIHRPGADGVGEIIARGANVMSGYYRDPEATARVVREGWFHTGDLGRLDVDGYLHVTGRLKDLIVTGAGKNVYPDEVEAELGPIEGVKEACVVGVGARAGAGEEVHLVAVLDGPADDAARAGVRAAVARACEPMQAHQRVQRIHFWDEDLPKTALGKVKRGQVKAKLEGEDATTEDRSHPGLSQDPATREIVALLARLARVPASSIRPDQSLSFDLGVDSLMLVELVAALESMTGATAAEEAAKDLSTVRDLLDLTRALQAGSAKGTKAVRKRAPAGVRAGIVARAAAPLVRTTWPLFYSHYLGLEVVGRDRLPSEGAYIIAANHQSHLDAPAILTALGSDSRRLHVVAARDYFFDTPWKGGFFAELLNAIPFDRSGDFDQGMDLCRTALRAGDPLLIFPEGTRSPDGLLQPFKAGLGQLALSLDVPIVPARIDGTHEALPKGAALPRPRRVRVAFGEPLSPATLVGENASLAYEQWRDVAEAVRHRIVELGSEPATRSA